MRVIIDGEAVDAAQATISVFDWGLFRGLGVFEVVRSEDGVPRHLDAHLDRLERGLSVLRLGEIDRAPLADAVIAVAAENDDGLIRMMVTAGGRDPEVIAPSHTIVVWEPMPALPDTLSLLPMRSPWHPATNQAGFAGVKWLSYAPNMASTDAAVAAGHDDALLTTMDDVVLELPTASIAWVSDGTLYTPSLDLGILLSITRDVTLGCARQEGIPVIEGTFGLDELLTADEVMALSTGKRVLAVGRVGGVEFSSGPLTARLAAAYGAQR
ncbi:MAG TPA: aminotransferase class IV [Acidimicrobiia bacterium]|nr:aminotransferase class IV [Acidimicrobiia bacterium]